MAIQPAVIKFDQLRDSQEQRTINVLDIVDTTMLGKYGQAVDSVAALRAISWASLSSGSTLGYYTPGDGGAASYYKDSSDTTSSDNGGTVIVANDGTRLKLVHFGCTNLYQWGVKGNGINDDTLSVQRAVTWADAGFKLIVPAWVGARLTSPILSTGSPAIAGEHIILNQTIGSNVNQTGKGSWFYLDHTGIGFSFNAGGLLVTRPKLSMVGTYRNQPTPGSAAWAPTAHDYDILFYNCDSVVRDIVLWNATQGIRITATAASSQSRGDLSGLYGAPLIGITVDFIADVLRIDNVHFWSYYWTSSAQVQAYFLSSAYAIQLYRCDNPMITRVFTYGYFRSLYIGSNSYGTSSKVKMSTFDFDAYGGSAVFLDATGISMQLMHGGGQGHSATSSINFLEFSSSSSGCNVAVSDIDVGLCANNALRVGGTANNVLRLGAGVRLYSWNGGGAGFPAVGCTDNNFVVLEAMPYFTAALNGGTNLDTNGNISGEVDLGTANYTTTGSGLVTIDAGMGRSPTALFATPTNTTPYFVQRVSANALGVYAAGGGALASGTITLSIRVVFK